MLARDPLVLKEFPHFLPAAEEIALAEELLGEQGELKRVFDEDICIGNDSIASLRRFCWQAREEKLQGKECAVRAVALIGECAALRSQLSLDSIIEAPPFGGSFWKLFLQTVPVSMHGNARGGQPMVAVRVGQIDVQAMEVLWSQGEAASVGDLNGTVLAFIRLIEILTRRWMASETSSRGETVDRALFVYDFAGFTNGHLRWLKDLLGTASKKTVALYPETVHRTIAVNVSWAISRLVWPIARTLLPPVSQKKILVLDSGSSREGLLREVEEHILPDFLGGSCTNWQECSSGRLALLSAEPEDIFHDAEED